MAKPEACAHEEQADAPAYKPSPFMKAAAQIIEASEGHVPDDLHWDPLTMSYGGGSHLAGDAIELPTELMMNLVGPGLAAVRHTKPSPAVPLAPSQERARKRLQLRKEAAAREAAEKAAQPEKEVEEPLDESWIDQLEQKDAKKKANREKAVQIRKERKKARKADAAAKQEALGLTEPQEAEEEDELASEAPPEPEVLQEPEDEDDDDDMQPVEQSKQRRKRQARQARQREEAELAKREEERKREEEKEAERKPQEKQQDTEKAMAQELKEAEQKRQEDERRQKPGAHNQEEDVRRMDDGEADDKMQEGQKTGEEDEDMEEDSKEVLKEEDNSEEESKNSKEVKGRQEARPEGERRRRGDREVEKRGKDKQDKDETKDSGEQPTQVKSLRQTLTPSQLRRQQRKRQREARRAAEAAAKEDDDSEGMDDYFEVAQVKQRPLERKSNERQSKKERQEMKPQAEEATDTSRPDDAKKGTATAQSVHSVSGVSGASLNSAAPRDTRNEEDPESMEATTRPSSELRKDAEAFPAPMSGSSSFDSSRRMQELDQNLMPMMGITTLMISQIPEQTDAESFRRQLDSWGFIGTYNFFYMPPDVSEGWGGRCVFINFVDQAMANMCMSSFQQCPSEGVAAPYSVQGLENNIAHFSQFVGAGDMVNGPLIVPTPTPSAWALNGAQAMINGATGKFSPQIRGQFHKTKMCAFHKKKKCTMGMACPFAHSKEELNAPPDLSKTKLCVNFFRRKCNDIHCKFAHGHSELRATGSVYKTELCRAWSTGTCKAGDTCRYAHGVKELRGGMSPMGYMGFSVEDEYMSVDGQMGCDVMGGLAGIWEDEAAAIQHYSGYGSLQSYSTQSGGDRGRSAPSSGFSSGQPQDGTGDGFNDAMSDMGLSDASTLCPGEGRLSRQQTAPPTASFPEHGRRVNGNVVLRVKGTFMESVFLDEEVERLPLRRSWSDGDLPQLQDMDGDQEL